MFAPPGRRSTVTHGQPLVPAKAGIDTSRQHIRRTSGLTRPGGPYGVRVRTPALRTAALPRRALALAAAALAHALLAAWLVLQLAPPEIAEPPAMQVTLLNLPPRDRPPPPKTSAQPPRASAATPPASARAARAPSAAPTAAAPAADWRVRPAEPQETQTARATLRARLGCRTADLLALTKAERAACDEALAKDAQNAPAYAVVSPKLKKVFDRTFECPKGDVWCEYRTGKAPYPGLLTPMRKKRDPAWD